MVLLMHVFFPPESIDDVLDDLLGDDGNLIQMVSLYIFVCFILQMFNSRHICPAAFYLAVCLLILFVAVSPVTKNI